MKRPTLTIYRDKAKGWRWRLRAKNGKIVADSSESYKTRNGAWLAADRLRYIVAGAVTMPLK